MNYDLKVLLPENNTLSLDVMSGEEFTIKMFMPSVVGAFIFENQAVFSQLMSGGADAKGMEFVTRLLSMILSCQFDFMTEEWIVKNISFPRQILIIRLFGDQLLRMVSEMGLSETAQPTKEPESE
mgnify:CR=1 FL=1